MNIACIAHDKKKEMMVQFCIAYKGILEKHSLFATDNTGKLISETTGPNVYRFLPGSQGGDQQIAARVAYNEIDMILFFRDPITPGTYEPEQYAAFKALRYGKCADCNKPCNSGSFNSRVGTRRFGLA